MSSFPQLSVPGGRATGAVNPGSLVTLKAGKMACVQKENSSKFIITPETVKGQLSLIRGDDDLIHFQWKNRSTNAIDDDFVIFPNEAEFKKVDTGVASDKVYLLQYKNSDRRFFYWLQGIDKADKPTENVLLNANKLSEYLNNPPPVVAQGAAPGAGGQFDQNALMQMLGSMGSGTGGATAASSLSASQMTDLQSILSNMGQPTNPITSSSSTGVTTASSAVTGTSVSSPTPDATSTPAATTTTQVNDMGQVEETEDELLQRAIEESMKEDDNGTAPGSNSNGPDDAVTAAVSSIPSTSSAITMEDMTRAMAVLQGGATRPLSLVKLLSNPQVMHLFDNPECQQELLALLPDTLQTPSELYATIQTPQFKNSVSTLSQAIQSGDYFSLATNFGLDPSIGMDKLNRGDVIGAFLEAIQAWGDQNKNQFLK